MRCYRHLSIVGSVVLLGALALAGASGVARAQGDLYTVENVAVDEKAENASAAREKALARGHVEALRTLLSRLLPPGELSRLPAIGPNEAAQLVRDFEVRNERTSAVRYLADLTFRFDEEAVRWYLRNQGIGHAETQSKPVLVLPVYGQPGQERLWEDPNVWWRTWASRPGQSGLVPIVAPLGDLQDVSTITAEQALAGDSGRLMRIAERYGAEDVLVVHAVPTPAVDGAAGGVQILTSRYGREPHPALIENVVQNPGEPLEQTYARAAETVAGTLQREWQQQTVLQPGTGNRITVRVPTPTLNDWLAVKQRLSGVAGVERAVVSKVSRSATELDIAYLGDERQLELAMQQRDLDLTYDTTEGAWLLRPRGAATPGG